MSPCLLGRARNTIWAGGGGGRCRARQGEGPPQEGDERMRLHVRAQMEGGFGQARLPGRCASLQVEVGQVYWREVGHRLWARQGRGFGVLVSAAEGVGPSRRGSGLCWCWGDRQKGGMVGHEEGESRVGGTGR